MFEKYINQILIVIFGSILLIGITSCFDSTAYPSNYKSRKADLKTIKKYLDVYKNEFGNYPDSLSDMVNNPKDKFIPSTKDTFGNKYKYAKMQDYIVLISFGLNDKPGGNNKDEKDIIFFKKRKD